MTVWQILKKRIPVFDWLPSYQLVWLVDDISAGMTVFVYCIPQTMAYAVLVGLPAVYGLYSSIAPMLIYACLGTSRQLSLAPMALTSLMLATTLKSVGYEEGSDQYIAAVMSVSLLTGLVILLLALMQLGSLTNLISPCVLSGFLTASGISIGVSQFNEILGFDMPRYRYLLQSLVYMLSHLNQVNVFSIIIGMTGWISLFLIRDWRLRRKSNHSIAKQISTSSVMTQAAELSSKLSYFIFIVIGAVVTRIIFSAGGELRIVGRVPSGLALPSFSLIPFNKLLSTVPNAIAISFVAFVGNWSLAKKYSQAYGHEVEATQELWALGLAVSIGVLFNAFIGAGGLGRSAVNAEAGARTQLSGCICAVLIMICVEFFTPLFYYIPMCVLAAVVEVSITSMVDFPTMYEAFHNSRRDFLVMLVTFIVTLFIGEAEGLFVGILFSLGLVVHRSAFPHVVHLGRIDASADEQAKLYPGDAASSLPLLPSGGGAGAGSLFKDVTKYPQAKQLPGVAIVRMEAALFFGNASYFKDIIRRAAAGEFHSFGDTPSVPPHSSSSSAAAVQQNAAGVANGTYSCGYAADDDDYNKPIKKVIVDATAWLDIDLTGVQALRQLCDVPLLASLPQNNPHPHSQPHRDSKSDSATAGSGGDYHIDAGVGSTKSSHGLLGDGYSTVSPAHDDYSNNNSNSTGSNNDMDRPDDVESVGAHNNWRATRPVFPSDRPQAAPRRGSMIVLCGAHERVMEMLLCNGVHFLRAEDLPTTTSAAMPSTATTTATTTAAASAADISDSIQDDDYEAKGATSLVSNFNRSSSVAYYPVSTSHEVTIFVASTIDIALCLPLPELQPRSTDSDGDSNSYGDGDGNGSSGVDVILEEDLSTGYNYSCSSPIEFEDCYDERRYTKRQESKNIPIPGISDRVGADGARHGSDASSGGKNTGRNPLHNIRAAASTAVGVLVRSVTAATATGTFAVPTGDDSDVDDVDGDAEFRPYQNRASPPASPRCAVNQGLHAHRHNNRGDNNHDSNHNNMRGFDDDNSRDASLVEYAALSDDQQGIHV